MLAQLAPSNLSRSWKEHRLLRNGSGNRRRCRRCAASATSTTREPVPLTCPSWRRRRLCHHRVPVKDAKRYPVSRLSPRRQAEQRSGQGHGERRHEPRNRSSRRPTSWFESGWRRERSVYSPVAVPERARDVRASDIHSLRGRVAQDDGTALMSSTSERSVVRTTRRSRAMTGLLNDAALDAARRLTRDRSPPIL